MVANKPSNWHFLHTSSRRCRLWCRATETCSVLPKCLRMQKQNARKTDAVRSLSVEIDATKGVKYYLSASNSKQIHTANQGMCSSEKLLSFSSILSACAGPENLRFWSTSAWLLTIFGPFLFQNSRQNTLFEIGSRFSQWKCWAIFLCFQYIFMPGQQKVCFHQTPGACEACAVIKWAWPWNTKQGSIKYFLFAALHWLPV